MTDITPVCLDSTAMSFPVSEDTLKNTQNSKAPTIPRPITIIDRPCGSGKTTSMLGALSDHKTYLCVVPLISECERVIQSTTKLYGEGFFVQPSNAYTTTKTEDLRTLLKAQRNVVTTHALFSSIAQLCSEGLLDDYHILIDEVPAPLRTLSRPKERAWQEIYVGLGYVTQCPATGRITTTEKWKADPDAVNDTLCSKLFSWASSGSLYLHNDTFMIGTMPEILLKTGKSLTFFTYKAEGSLLTLFLKWLGLEPTIETDPTVEDQMKQQARELVTVKMLPKLKGISLSHSSQQTYGEKAKEAKAIVLTLRDLRRGELSKADHGELLITCAKDRWFKGGSGPNDTSTPKAGAFSKGSRLFTTATWLPNTTRGTNDYIDASHLIYLYDQHPNPSVVPFLGAKCTKQFSQAYALTELIQWVWRSRVRRGEPITVYVASERMQRVFEGWRKKPRHTLES